MIRRDRICALVLATLIANLATPVWARDPSDLLSQIPSSYNPGLSLSQELGGASSGSEYVSGNYPGAILMPVNLWGSIGKPGIHHIPTQTDLLTLLSLAGGTMSDAELGEVLIKRRAGPTEQVLKVNVQDMLETVGAKIPVLEANDIVVIPRQKPVISNNTVNTISFIASLMGIILAGYAVSQIK